MTKQRKQKVQQNKNPKEKKAKQLAEHVQLPDAHAGDDVDVSDEDIQFVEQSKRRIGFLSRLDPKELDQAVKRSQIQADQAKQKAEQAASDTKVADEDEAEYEKLPRQLSQANLAKDSKAQLPVKTLSGEVAMEVDAKSATPRNIPGITVVDERELEAARKLQQEAARQALEREEQQAAKRQRREEPHTVTKKAAEGTGPVGALQAALGAARSQEQRRVTAREAMAVAASKLLEDPEGNVGELRVLMALVRDEDAQVSRLCMLSLLAVFKDIIPGYRIRLAAEEDGVKVSKEVQKVRDFEAGLLKQYQLYLKALLAAAEAHGHGGLAHARIATRCMCTLLTTHSHFNYTSDLLMAVVPRMASGDDELRGMACGAIQELLRQDVQGKVALEAVQLVADLVKRRKCVCAPEVVSSLSVLRFSEVKREDVAVRKKSHKAEGKKEKARKRKQDEVDRAFKESELGPSLDQKVRAQSAMLEALFEVYFRVLKHCVGSGLGAGAGAAATSGLPISEERADKKFPLLAPVMQGLSSYTHLISVDYFNDLMDVFRQLLRASWLPLPLRLRCLLAATDVLRGQGEALTVDRRDFYTQLYAALPSCALAQLLEQQVPEKYGKAAAEAKAMEVEESEQEGLVGASDPQGEAAAELMVRAANQMLCETKSSDMARLAAFLKRIVSVALHCPPGAAMGFTALAFRLLRRNPRLGAMLEWEGEAPVGGRSYNPTMPDPSEAGALAACLWELSLLHSHYHPHVAQAAQALLSLTPSSNQQPSGPLTSPSLPHELVAMYSVARGGFRPAPQRPPKRRAQVALGRRAQQEAPEVLVARLCEGIPGLEAAPGDGEEQDVDFTTHCRQQMQYQRNAELRQELKRLRRMAEQVRQQGPGRRRA